MTVNNTTVLLSNISTKYQFVILNQSIARNYEELTYPYFRWILQYFTIEAPIIGIGVELGQEPIGLILARYNQFPEENKLYGEILSWFVVPSYRRQGIGKELLARIEQELQKRGCNKITINYLSSFNTPFIEKILARQNWLTPETKALVCYATTANVENTKKPHLTQYLDRLLSHLPHDYTIFPWYTLTPEEREIIEQEIHTNPLVRKFNPFWDETQLEPLNSLGLRYQNRVVGWVITHRIAPDTIRYTQMFVYPDTQPLSRSILLLAKAIQLQVEAQQATKGTFRVDMDNKPMVKFVYRRLAPYLDEIRKAWQVSKCLDSQQ